MFKKRSRLKGFDYKGKHRYFITICTHEKKPLFEQGSLTERLIEYLRSSSKNFGFKVWAFCFMPDHVHLLLEGEGADSDLRRFITSFKQRTGYFYRINSPGIEAKGNLWQPSFYDHVLRKEEDTLEVARYILNNPVRKGLTEDFDKYEFSGSLDVEISEMF